MAATLRLMTQSFQTKVGKDKKFVLDKKSIVGIGGILGNVLYTVYGVRRAMLDGNMASGVMVAGESALSLVGHGIMSSFGTYNIDKQYETLEKRLLNHLKQNGTSLASEDLAKASEYEFRTMGQQIVEYVQRNPAEMAMAYNAALSPLLIGGGLSAMGPKAYEKQYTKAVAEGKAPKTREAMYKSGLQETISGSLIGLGCILSSVIGEESPNITDKKDSPSFLRKIQNKPTLIHSATSTAANIFFLGGGIQELVSNVKSGKGWIDGTLKTTYGAIFLASAILMGTASKKPTGEPEEHEEGRKALLEKAMEVIALQPPELQEETLYDVAQFLSFQKELRFDDKGTTEIIDMLKAQIPLREQAVEQFLANQPVASLGR